MRPEETQGRVGKQPDGSAKSREGKLLVTWTAETRTPEGRPQRDWGSVRYSAAIESAACRDTDPEIPPFQARVRRAAQRGGFGPATRSVVLGDGAAWIWRLAQEEFPGAIQIVDLWHAKEHPWEVSQAIHGPGEAADAWARARCDELDAGDLPAVLAALRPHVATCEDARKGRDFIERNRARMQYAEFRAQGCASDPASWRPLQDRRGPALEAVRHALDARRRQRHARLAQLHSQRGLRRLLGTARRPHLRSRSEWCRTPVQPGQLR